LRDVQLYRLAKQFVPWKEDEEGDALRSELKFLKTAIVEKNTFNTFVKFQEAWRSNDACRGLVDYLPSVEDLTSRSQVV
jgi:hypothetical protein